MKLIENIEHYDPKKRNNIEKIIHYYTKKHKNIQLESKWLFEHNLHIQTKRQKTVIAEHVRCYDILNRHKRCSQIRPDETSQN